MTEQIKKHSQSEEKINYKETVVKRFHPRQSSSNKGKQQSWYELTLSGLMYDT